MEEIRYDFEISTLTVPYTVVGEETGLQSNLKKFQHFEKNKKEFFFSESKL